MSDREVDRAKWWANWWAEDYSWDALANRVRSNHSSKDDDEIIALQEYWRDEEPFLITGPDGKRWTRFHLPLHWQDGSETDKRKISAQPEFLTALYARLANPDLQFDGCILPHFVFRSDDRALRIAANNFYCFESVSFSNCRFEAVSKFHRAWFEGHADFSECTFEKICEFARARFVAGCSFGSTKFRENAEFQSVTFESTAWFGSAVFNSAHFPECTFEDNACFNSVTFRGDAHFQRCSFVTNAQFFDVKFQGGCFFASSLFSRGDFHNSTFAKQVQFNNAVWSGVASFAGANFASAESISFSSGNFRSVAEFFDVRWPTNARAFGGAMRDTVFERLVSLTGPDFGAFALFSGVTFKSDFVFDVGIILDDVAFNRAISAAETAAHSDVRLAKSHGIDLDLSLVLDAHLLELEGAMRALRHASEGLKDQASGQRFYRFELMCRERQSFTSEAEYVALSLYSMLSDYGRSFARPLIWIAVSWLTLAFVFWIWGVVLDPTLPSKGMSAFDSAAQLSARDIFLPFSVWRAESQGAFESLSLTPPGVGTLARVVASFHSLFVILLAFLAGLAIRRRFQLA